VKKYERHQLEYALDRVTFGSTQVRLRNALTIGALEKVGVIPFLIGVVYGGYKLYEWWLSHPLSSFQLSGGVGVAIGLSLVYVYAIGQHPDLQQLDQVVLALKHAVEAKKYRESSGNADLRHGPS
jgi:hypothetical protein